MGARRRLFRSMLRGALLLMIAALAGGGLVASVHEATAERIEANERAALLSSLNALVPADHRDNDPLKDTIELIAPNYLGSPKPLTAYRARMGDKPVAVILTVVAPNGYSGGIKMLVAIHANGVLSGVRVINHRETPGLGDKIEIEKHNWIRSFNGKSIGNPPPSGWAVRKDGGQFDQFTGATITPRAVVRAVYNALRYFGNEKQRLLAPPPPPVKADDSAEIKEAGEPQQPSTTGVAGNPRIE